MEIQIERVCPMCGKISTVTVTEEGLRAYKAGVKSIQDCFPTLSADDRELIKTGICEKCWEVLT